MNVKENQKTYEYGKYAPLVAIVVASVLIIAGLIAALTATSNDYSTARRYLNNLYTDAVYQTDEGLITIQNELAKLTVAGKSSFGERASSSLAKTALVCENNVGYLPVSYESTLALSSFLNQVSDFATSTPDDNYQKNVNTLYSVSKQMSSAFKQFMRTFDESVLSNFPSNNTDMIFDNIDYPQVIYDGPFSDGIKEKCFKGLQGYGEVTEERAVQLVSDLFNATQIQLLANSDQPQGYIFGMMVNDKYATVTVSKRGGIPVSFTVDCDASNALQKEEAIQLAKEYATKLGFDKLDAVWYNQMDGYNFVNLAPVKNGVKYYTDLVKVKLAGNCLAGFEATGYCLNHTERDSLPMINESSAIKSLPKQFKINASSLCVIPLPKNEKLCYEFYGLLNDELYYVYVNAQNAQIENVLKLINDNRRGELVI